MFDKSSVSPEDTPFYDDGGDGEVEEPGSDPMDVYGPAVTQEEPEAEGHSERYGIGYDGPGDTLGD